MLSRVAFRLALIQSRSRTSTALRRHSRITAPTWRPRFDGIVPFWMPRAALDVQRSHLGIGDFDPLGIAFLIQFAVHRQAGFGRRGGDQVDHRDAADERLSAPVLRDVAEHAVLDLVPLRGSRWIVTDLEA